MCHYLKLNFCSGWLQVVLAALRATLHHPAAHQQRNIYSAKSDVRVLIRLFYHSNIPVRETRTSAFKATKLHKFIYSSIQPFQCVKTRTSAVKTSILQAGISIINYQLFIINCQLLIVNY